MMATPLSSLETTSPTDPSAVERAIAFGVDITLLIENLRLTPTERVQRAQRMLDAVVAVQAEAQAWRERQRQPT